MSLDDDTVRDIRAGMTASLDQALAAVNPDGMMAAAELLVAVQKAADVFAEAMPVQYVPNMLAGIVTSTLVDWRLAREKGGA